MVLGSVCICCWCCLSGGTSRTSWEWLRGVSIQVTVNWESMSSTELVGSGSGLRPNLCLVKSTFTQGCMGKPSPQPKARKLSNLIALLEPPSTEYKTQGKMCIDPSVAMATNGKARLKCLKTCSFSQSTTYELASTAVGGWTNPVSNFCQITF